MKNNLKLIGADFIGKDPWIDDKYVGFAGILNHILKTYQLEHNTDKKPEVDLIFTIKESIKNGNFPSYAQQAYSDKKLDSIQFPFHLSPASIFQEANCFDYEKTPKERFNELNKISTGFFREIAQDIKGPIIPFSSDHSLAYLSFANAMYSGKISPEEVILFVVDKHADVVTPKKENSELITKATVFTNICEDFNLKPEQIIFLGAYLPMTDPYLNTMEAIKDYGYNVFLSKEKSALEDKLDDLSKKGFKKIFVSVDLDGVEGTPCTAYTSNNKPDIPLDYFIKLLSNIKREFEIIGADTSELFLRHNDYELVKGVLRPNKNALKSFDTTKTIINTITT